MKDSAQEQQKHFGVAIANTEEPIWNVRDEVEETDSSYKMKDILQKWKMFGS